MKIIVKYKLWEFEKVLNLLISDVSRQSTPGAFAIISWQKYPNFAPVQKHRVTWPSG